MPIVRKTETGNHYIEKLNTGGDICGRTAIRSYHKATATAGQTEFDLPFIFEPATYTTWVFVDGVKAVYVASGDYSAPSDLKYDETGTQQITFYGARTIGEVIEFVIAGSYQGDSNSGSGGLAPDLSLYKTRYGADIGSGAPQNFLTDQPMGGYIFTGLGVGGNSATPTTDSVRFDQLGGYTDAGGVHYHVQLFDSAGSSPVLSTVSNYTSITGNTGKVEITGSNPEIYFTQTGGADMLWKVYDDTLYFQGRQGVAAFADIMTVDAATLEASFHNDLHMNGDASNHKIRGVDDGTASSDVATFGQLEEYRGVQRIAPQSVYVLADVTPPLLGAGTTVTYLHALSDANTLYAVPTWCTGLMFRVVAEINQSGGVLGSGESHDLTVEFAYNTGSNWEEVAQVTMADAAADINNTVWTGICIQEYTASNNNNYRFRWTDNRSTTSVTNPTISIRVELIGFYR